MPVGPPHICEALHAARAWWHQKQEYGGRGERGTKLDGKAAMLHAQHAGGMEGGRLQRAHFVGSLTSELLLVLPLLAGRSRQAAPEPGHCHRPSHHPLDCAAKITPWRHLKPALRQPACLPLARTLPTWPGRSHSRGAISVSHDSPCDDVWEP